MNSFEKWELLIGTEEFNIIKKSKVIIFGLGGVGSFACEMIARAGIEDIGIVDYDKVEKTNINRQLIADENTIGLFKTDVMKTRLKAINPNIKVADYKIRYSKGNNIDLTYYDYIIDAIDDVHAKVYLIQESKRQEVPIISCMGTANRKDPTKFKIADINRTHECKLAKAVRRELRLLDIKKVKVLFSTEQIDKEKKGTSPFTPSIGGILIAKYVILELIKKNPLSKR